MNPYFALPAACPAYFRDPGPGCGSGPGAGGTRTGIGAGVSRWMRLRGTAPFLPA